MPSTIFLFFVDASPYSLVANSRYRPTMYKPPGGIFMMAFPVARPA
jgi:hypothetical protein